MGINLKEHLSQWINAAGWYRVQIKKVEAFRSTNDNPGLEYHFADIVTGRTGKASFFTHDKAVWVLANFCADIGMPDNEIEDFGRNMPLERKCWVRMESNKDGYQEPVQWLPDSETAPADVVTQSAAQEPVRAIDRDDNNGQPTPQEEEGVGEDEPDVPF